MWAGWLRPAPRRRHLVRLWGQPRIRRARGQDVEPLRRSPAAPDSGTTTVPCRSVHELQPPRLRAPSPWRWRSGSAGRSCPGARAGRTPSCSASRSVGMRALARRLCSRLPGGRRHVRLATARCPRLVANGVGAGSRPCAQHRAPCGRSGCRRIPAHRDLAMMPRNPSRELAALATVERRRR